MSWHSIRGHDAVVDTLRRNLAAGRMPHALLFVGPEGVGKKAVALVLAQALLCERRPETALDPCGECPSCLQVMAGTHPDLLRVRKPDDKTDLPIKVIRDLNADLGLKPMRAGRKVAIVDDADDMNDEAANAFLKTLEEPPPNSVLILLGTSAEVQLDTIVSRCRVVRFDPLPAADLAAVLLDRGLAPDPAEAARLAALGEGSVGRAVGLAEPELAGFRRALIDEIGFSTGLDPSLLARRVEEFCSAAGKEGAAKRDRASLLIGELARFFRAALWQTAGLEPPSADPMDRRAVAALAPRVEPEDVFLLAERCLLADYQVRRMAHLGLVFESLFHDLARDARVRPEPPRR